jgi:hypothetical protein
MLLGSVRLLLRCFYNGIAIFFAIAFPFNVHVSVYDGVVDVACAPTATSAAAVGGDNASRFCGLLID